MEQQKLAMSSLTNASGSGGPPVSEHKAPEIIVLRSQRVARESTTTTASAATTAALDAGRRSYARRGTRRATVIPSAQGGALLQPHQVTNRNVLNMDQQLNQLKEQSSALLRGLANVRTPAVAAVTELKPARQEQKYSEGKHGDATSTDAQRHGKKAAHNDELNAPLLSFLTPAVSEAWSHEWMARGRLRDVFKVAHTPRISTDSDDVTDRMRSHETRVTETTTGVTTMEVVHQPLSELEPRVSQDSGYSGRRSDDTAGNADARLSLQSCSSAASDDSSVNVEPSGGRTRQHLSARRSAAVEVEDTVKDGSSRSSSGGGADHVVPELNFTVAGDFARSVTAVIKEEEEAEQARAPDMAELFPNLYEFESDLPPLTYDVQVLNRVLNDAKPLITRAIFDIDRPAGNTNSTLLHTGMQRLNLIKPCAQSYMNSIAHIMYACGEQRYGSARCT